MGKFFYSNKEESDWFNAFSTWRTTYYIFIQKKHWKWLIISGFIGSFLPSFLFSIAETEIDSAIASILNSLVPLNTILFGFAVFKIASSKRQILGVIIGFIGTSILIGKGAELHPDPLLCTPSMLILLSAIYKM